MTTVTRLHPNLQTKHTTPPALLPSRLRQAQLIDPLLLIWARALLLSSWASVFPRQYVRGFISFLTPPSLPLLQLLAVKMSERKGKEEEKPRFVPSLLEGTHQQG